MSEYVYAGLTSQTVDIFLQDSSSSTGQGLSGLVYNSAGLVASYRKGATGSRVAITLATQTVGGAYSSGGFVEIDATNMKGVYRLDLPNAAVDTEGFVTLYLYGATNLLPTPLRIDCRALPVDVKKLLGTAWLTPGTAGTPDVNVKLWNALTTVALPLVPTTAGRTLDVSAGGEAGVDWANVGSPTATVGLSGTTVKTATDVETDTQDIQGRIPTALVSGRIDASVGAMDANTMTASALATDAVTEIQAGLATSTNVTDAQAAIIVQVDANEVKIDAVKAKTDNLPTDPADQSLIIDATNTILGRLPAALESGRIAAVLDSAARVKLDASQPDYVPATAAAVAAEAVKTTAIQSSLTTVLARFGAWTGTGINTVLGAFRAIAAKAAALTPTDLSSGTTFNNTTDSLEAIRDNQAASSGASLEDIIAGVQSVSSGIIAAQDESAFYITEGDTWVQDIENLGNLTDKTVIFAIKSKVRDTDAQSIVYIEEGVGLSRLNGAATTAGWGSIEILDETTGDIRVRLESNATALLSSGTYVDAVKAMESTDDRTLRQRGKTIISAGVINDIS